MRLERERPVLENMKELFVLVLVATVTTIAAADPSQWSSRSGAGYTQFVPPTSDGSEVRVHRAEAASDRDAWLRARRGRGPEGVTLGGAYQPVASPQPSVEVAFGRGRRGNANVMVLSVACTTADRRMSYAEVISPEAVFQSDADDGLRIAIRECAGPVATSDPAAPAAPATPARPAPTRAAPTNTAPAPDTAAARSQVFGIGGDSVFRAYAGVAGYVPIDILLLRSGWASTHLEAVLVPGGPEAHRAQHPDAWMRWRRAGGVIKVCSVKNCNDEKSWRAVAYGYVNELQSKGFRFAGAFHSVGGGTVGDTTALSHGFVTFSADGRFSTSSASSVSVNHWSPSSGTTGIASGGGKSANDGGTYEVDGLVLTLRFDDGTVRYRTIQISKGKSSPTAPSSITIDGTMYSRM